MERRLRGNGGGDAEAGAEDGPGAADDDDDRTQLVYAVAASVFTVRSRL